MTLTLNAVIKFFPQDTLAYDDVSWDQLWLPRNQQFRKYSRKSYFDHMSPHCDLDLEDSNNNKSFSSAWNSGSWCCTTRPNLVTKCYVIQKLSSGQTFTDTLNLHCDLDPTRINPFFLQDTQAYDAVLWNQVWLQTDQQFKRIVEIVIIWYISPHCDLDIDDSKSVFFPTLRLLIIDHHTKFG